MSEAPRPLPTSAFGDRYLTNPDLFPARFAGESWGNLEVELEVAGSRVRFGGLCEWQVDEIRHHYQPLIVDSEGASDIRVGVFRAPAVDFVQFNRGGWEYVTDIEYGPNDTRLAGIRFMGRIAWQPGLRAAIWTADDGHTSVLGAVENLLRTLTAYDLVARGGALVHSAGVVHHGKAVLFVGRSGAGKSTTARICRELGIQVLSDDMNAILPSEEGGFEVRRVPFTGVLDLPQTASTRAPLAAVFRLVQSETIGAEALPAAELLSQLLVCSPYVNADPMRRDALISNLGACVDQVPGYSLRFKPDPSFWPRVDALIPS